MSTNEVTLATGRASEWAEVQLADIAKFINGYAFKPVQWGDQGRPIIRIQNLTGTGREYNYFEGDLPKKFLVLPGDLLVSWSASLNAFVWTGPEAWLNQHIFKVSDVTDDVDESFLYYSLLSVISDIRSRTHGSTMKHINRQEFLATRLTLPSLPEQRAIAHVLRTVQRAKEQTEQVVAAAQELKRSLAHYLFQYGPVSTKNAEATPLLDTEFGVAREDWTWAELGRHAYIRYGLGKPPAQDAKGIPMIRATNIKRGRIVPDDMMYVVRESVPDSKDAFLRSDDILVVRSGAYTGDVALVTEGWKGAVAGYDLVVSPAAGLMAGYCAQWLLADVVQRYFRSQRDRSAQPHINKQQLEATPVVLPSEKEQMTVAQWLEAVDNKIRVEEAKQDVLEILFRSLLRDLMSAKIRVTDIATDEC